MKIAVVGLGAVGGLVAARLAMAGHEVSALARGATLAAVRSGGLRLAMAGQEHRTEIRASDDARALGAQDLVVIALKGQALAEAGASIQPLLGAETVVLPAMNGVPWWFLQTLPAGSGLDAAALAAPLASIDPDGRIAAALPLARVLGCVVHLTCSSPEPGLVRHGFGDRLIVGEPAGGASERTASVCAALAGAGFTAEASTDIRHDVWYKLWGNMTMNPISAFTGATVDRLLADPLVRNFCTAVMREAAAVGDRIGCRVDEQPEARHQITAKLGAFKTSMLQDVEAGRPIELDALVTVVRDMAQRLAVPTPHLDALLGLARAFGRERGLYAAPAA